MAAHVLTCFLAAVREAPKSGSTLAPTPSAWATKRIRRTKEQGKKKRVHSSSLGPGGPRRRDKFGAVPPVLGRRTDGVGGEAVTRSTWCSPPAGAGAVAR